MSLTSSETKTGGTINPPNAIPRGEILFECPNCGDFKPSLFVLDNPPYDVICPVMCEDCVRAIAARPPSTGERPDKAPSQTPGRVANISPKGSL